MTVRPRPLRSALLGTLVLVFVLIVGSWTPPALAPRAAAPAPSLSAPVGPSGTGIPSSSSATSALGLPSSAPVSKALPRAASPALGIRHQLRGVDRSGTEYACIQGWGYGDGPYDLASVQAIRSWSVTAVRVPLNEDCWLDINVNGTSAAAWSGAGYRAFIVAYVDLLESQGIRPIIDLHWNAPGTNQSVGQEPMADESHAPAFWASVASTFANDSLVIFDLYNEPYGISWNCWLNGCFQTYTNPGWQTAGMQQLLDVVRAAGADTQLVILGGLNWSNDESGWLSHEPVDPAGPGLLGASLHMYQGNSCDTWTCWNTTLLPIVHAGIPLLTGEMGEGDCEAEFLYAYWAWADPLQVSYLGWTWDDWNTCTGPVLIADYTGTPYDTYGTAFRDHLRNQSIPVASVPSAPQLVAATPGNQSVVVSWAAPASNGTWPVENYEVGWGTTSGVVTQNVTTGSGMVLDANVTGLTNGQTYDLSVRAWSPIGWGPWSAPVVAMPRPTLVATADVSPLSGTAPLGVTFVASAYGGTGGYTAFWTFGDGNSSHAQEAEHTYNLPGAYPVILTCNDSGGDSAVVIAGIVDVAAPGPALVAFANATPNAGDAPLTVSFQGNAHGGSPPYAYAWVFGDGGTSASPSPEHTYARAGAYVARLWVNDSAGGSVMPSTAEILVQVAAPMTVTVAAEPQSGNAPLLVAFVATVAGGTEPFSVNWTFGDGATGQGASVDHNYTKTGTFQAVATVRDAEGRTAQGNATLDVAAPCQGCNAAAPAYVPPVALYAGIGALLAALILAGVLFHLRGVRQRKERAERGEDGKLPPSSPVAPTPPGFPPQPPG